MAENQKPGDAYMLERGIEASTRLFAQHFMLRERMKDLLQPELQTVAQRHGARIADVATGNAVWALQAAKEYPESEVVGLDISNQQYPPAWTVPPNLSLDRCDVLQPLSEKFARKFDIVHIRLLIGGLKGRHEFKKVIEYCAGLLKPGGYLQWQDVYFPGWQTVSPSLEVDNSKLPDFVEVANELRGFSARFVDLTSVMEEEPIFTDVLHYEPPIVPWLLEYETNINAKTFSEILQIARKVFAQSEEKMAIVEAAQRGMDEYLRNSGMLALRTQVVTAKKVDA